MWDNGGEFVNDEVMELAEKYNIVTAAESPWSNGLCERHNALLARNIHKIRLDVGCSDDIALAWSLCAKNSMANVYGFSPNQLVFGKNPNLPNILNNRLPANNSSSTSKVLEQHLVASHKAREEFVRAESCEKIKRALSKKTRSYADRVYCSGESVYFKRSDSNSWHGPAKVLGRDGQTYLLKNGGFYVRVHPCRMSPIGSVNVGGAEDAAISEQNEPSVSTSDSCAEHVSPTLTSEHPDDSDSESNPIQLQEIDHTPVTTEATSATTHGPAVCASDLPKIKEVVCFKSNNTGNWITGSVESRGGRVTGKHWHHLNIRLPNLGEVTPVSFRDDISEWRKLPPPAPPDPNNGNRTDNEANQVEFVYLGKSSSSDKFSQAKLDEIAKWNEMNVFQEVDNQGQSVISTRWICTEKVKGGVLTCKARLVARGFEEDASQLLKNSPTCTKDAFRLLLSFLATHHWDIQTIDMKSAFLQGKTLSREIFLKPPKEAQTSKVWRLNKAVYGLTDAGRHWYERVKEEFLSLGLTISKVDKAVFSYSVDNQCHGLIIAHVDDFLFGGDKLFEDNIISKIKQTFVVGLEESKDMKYLGLEVKQNQSGIHLSMEDYIDSIDGVLHCDDANKERSLNAQEYQQFRQVVGQINWCATQVRVDVCFNNCQLSNASSSPSLKQLIVANKTVKDMKSTNLSIKFSVLHGDHIKLLVFSDASFANLPSGGSQGAFVIFLADLHGNSNIISWQSRKVKRVCKSTLSAECLAAVEAVGAAIFLKQLISDCECWKEISIVLICDNKSLIQAVHSITPVEDKRLRIDVAILQEALERKEVENICYVPSNSNLANALTKQGASTKTLISALSGQTKYQHSKNCFE